MDYLSTICTGFMHLNFQASAKIHARIQGKQGFWKRRKKVLEMDRKHLFGGRKANIFQLGGLVWEGSRHTSILGLKIKKRGIT